MGIDEPILLLYLVAAGLRSLFASVRLFIRPSIEAREDRPISLRISLGSPLLLLSPCARSSTALSSSALSPAFSFFLPAARPISPPLGLSHSRGAIRSLSGRCLRFPAIARGEPVALHSDRIRTALFPPAFFFGCLPPGPPPASISTRRRVPTVRENMYSPKIETSAWTGIYDTVSDFTRMI